MSILIETEAVAAAIAYLKCSTTAEIIGPHSCYQIFQTSERETVFTAYEPNRFWATRTVVHQTTHGVPDTQFLVSQQSFHQVITAISIAKVGEVSFSYHRGRLRIAQGLTFDERTQLSRAKSSLMANLYPGNPADFSPMPTEGTLVARLPGGHFQIWLQQICLLSNTKSPQAECLVRIQTGQLTAVYHNKDSYWCLHRTTAACHTAEGQDSIDLVIPGDLLSRMANLGEEVSIYLSDRIVKFSGRVGSLAFIRRAAQPTNLLRDFSLAQNLASSTVVSSRVCFTADFLAACELLQPASKANSQELLLHTQQDIFGERLRLVPADGIDGDVYAEVGLAELPDQEFTPAIFSVVTLRRIIRGLAACLRAQETPLDALTLRQYRVSRSPSAAPTSLLEIECRSPTPIKTTVVTVLKAASQYLDRVTTDD